MHLGGTHGGFSPYTRLWATDQFIPVGFHAAGDRLHLPVIFSHQLHGETRVPYQWSCSLEHVQHQQLIPSPPGLLVRSIMRMTMPLFLKVNVGGTLSKLLPGVSFTLINENVKICAKRSGKTDWFTSQRSVGKRRARRIHLNAPLPEHWHMASCQCHTPSFAHWLSSPPGQKQLRGTRPPESNIIKVVFGHEGAQRSPVTARNIRPNTQAPVHGLHGCVPSWFHYTLLQTYHAIVTSFFGVLLTRPFLKAPLLPFKIRTE